MCVLLVCGCACLTGDNSITGRCGNFICRSDYFHPSPAPCFMSNQSDLCACVITSARRLAAAAAAGAEDGDVLSPNEPNQKQQPDGGLTPSQRGTVSAVWWAHAHTHTRAQVPRTHQQLCVTAAARTGECSFLLLLLSVCLRFGSVRFGDAVDDAAARFMSPDHLCSFDQSELWSQLID